MQSSFQAQAQLGYPTPLASSKVSSAAEISLQPVVFWPHQSGEKSLEPWASAACLMAVIAVAA